MRSDDIVREVRDRLPETKITLVENIILEGWQHVQILMENDISSYSRRVYSIVPAEIVKWKFIFVNDNDQYSF